MRLTARSNWAVYRPCLLRALRTLGEGMVESLTRTGVKTEAAYAEDEHMLRESAALVGSADTKLDELCRKYTGVRIADGKGRAREEFVVVNAKVSPAPTEDGHDYYYADCCRLGEDGKTPGGAVGPVSGEILPSMRETFYIHHEDESFKHVPFGELVSAYSSDP